MAVAAILLVPAVAAGAARTEVRPYVGGGAEAAANVCTFFGNYGGACFFLRDGDATLRIDVDDASGDVVFGTWTLHNATERTKGAFCGGTDLVLPPRPRTLEVRPSAVEGELYCTGGGFATRGNVTITVG